MIASKIICDDTYSNKSWCIVGQGMFALREINQMEREMCSYLEWILNVKPKELAEFEAEVKKDYSSGGAKATDIPAAPAATTATTTWNIAIRPANLSSTGLKPICSCSWLAAVSCPIIRRHATASKHCAPAYAVHTCGLAIRCVASSASATGSCTTTAQGTAAGTATGWTTTRWPPSEWST